jgi:hypothetical protein
MRRKVLSAVFIFALLLIPIQTSYALSKPGDLCPKIGKSISTAKGELLCTKVGKKQKWVASPAPIMSNKEFEKMWAGTKSGSYEVFNKANFMQRKNPSEVDITWRISPTVPSEISKEFIRQYEYSAQFWSTYAFTDYPLQVIVISPGEIEYLCKWRDDFLKSNSKECASQLNNPTGGGWIAGTTQSRGMATDWYMVPKVSTLKQVDFLPRIPHEFFHNVQHDQNKNYKSVLPCWVEEGSAEYFGELLSSEGDLKKFIGLRNQTAQSINGPNRAGAQTPKQWKDWLYSADMTSTFNNSTAGGCQKISFDGIYQHAVLANEYLVKTLGISGVVSLYKNSANLGWDKALESAFSKEKDQIYSEIAEYMYKEFTIIRNNKWSYSFIQP